MSKRNFNLSISTEHCERSPSITSSTPNTAFTPNINFNYEDVFGDEYEYHLGIKVYLEGDPTGVLLQPDNHLPDFNQTPNIAKNTNVNTNTIAKPKAEKRRQAFTPGLESKRTFIKLKNIY